MSIPPMPFSQFCGVFHGRTEALSGSVLAQPEIPAAKAARARSKMNCAARSFISDGRMCRADLVAFNRLAQFPARNDVGDGTVFLDAADDDFGHELAVAADQHFSIRENALIIANVENDKIPFGIH